MPSCFDILNQILTRSGLDRKAGHPLYRYRVTTEELKQLRQELQFQLEDRGELRMPEEFAAFCLFGAEWFRRNYQSGPWSWDVIFDGLNLVGAKRPNTQVTAGFVRRGLQYWNVRLLSTQLMNLYLRTLVCQGGFPINTLRNNGAGISRLLKACLRDHERYPTEPMDEILSHYIHFVPPTLQTGEVRGLARDLVQAIASLRNQSDQAQAQGISRAEYLNQNARGWEAQLPLRVEDPDAKELLLSLLDAAKSEPFSRHALSLSTSMTIDGDSATMIRSLRCPSTLTEDAFRRVGGFAEKTALLPRMTGYLQAGDQRVPAISISRSSDGTAFRITKHAVASVSGEQAFHETSLILAVGGEEIQRVVLPGGEALPDSPWIFTSGDPHQLIGVGSARPRDESVLVALPPACEVIPDDAAELAELTCQIAGRTMLKLAGGLSLRCDDIQYRIVTRSDATHDCLYELRGKRRRLGTGGSEVWCGPPTVWQIPLSEDEAPSEVPRELVQWKPVVGGQWTGHFTNCLGHVQIRVSKGTETRYLVRCVVLPAATGLRVVPGAEPGTGELRISGLGPCRLAVERNDSVSVSAQRAGSLCVLQVDVTGERPGLLHLRLSFENGNECDVSAVCPTTCYSILDAAGQSVNYPSGIPAESLDGLTLQVIQPSQQAPLIYWPDGPLLIDQMRETNVTGVFEFPLSYIANYATELLACSDDLDGKITFGVGKNIAFQPKFRWQVTRYSHALSRVRTLAQIDGNEASTEICVQGLVGNTAASDAGFELTVVPLGSPNDEMPQESVISTSHGRWILDHADYAPGYYLALARDSKHHCFRPLRFVVKASQIGAEPAVDGEAEPDYLTVMNMAGKQSRLPAWDQYFVAITADLAHPDWSRIDDLVQSSETLPITTYDAVAALTRNHLAAARYGILYPGREALWRRFEQLPFLWSAIPIRAWLTMAWECWSFTEKKLQEGGFSTSEVGEILRRQRDLFAKESPNRSRHMSSVAMAMFATDRFGIGFNQIDWQALNREVREQERTRLIAHHGRFDTRSTWPNFRIECTPEERAVLHTVQLIFDDGFNNQWAALNGPGIAAVKAVYGDGISSQEIVEYKRLRALDPEWYDTANAVAMSVLLHAKYQAEPNYFADLLKSTQP